MKSGLRRIRNQGPGQPPVPMAPYGYRRGSMFNLGTGTADKLTQLRAYGMSGTVFSIVSLLAQAAASPKWHLYKKTKDGRVRYTTGDQGSDQRTEVVQHAALTLWNKPNAFHSGFEFREGANQHQELTGETIWVLDNEAAGFPTSMWYVRPDRIDPVPDPTDFLLGWIYTGPNGEQVPLQLDQVIIEKLPDPLDPFRGAGPVQSIMANIQQQNFATQYQRNLFLNGADPGAIIELPTKFTEPEWDDFTNRWRESHQGVARAGRVAILENGAKWISPAGTTNKDMEYANLRLANRDELREAWRMHKAMLGTVEDVNRANAQTAEEVFVSWMEIPRLERRKDTLDCKLLPLFGATGQGVEFDYDDPSPDNREEDNGELTAKTTSFSVLVTAGVDPDDAAEVVGLPSMAMVEKATQMPVAPPGWVPAPPAAPSGGSGSSDSDSDSDSGSPGPPQARQTVRLYDREASARAIQQEAGHYPASAIAWMYSATWTGPVQVPQSHIDPDMSAMDTADPEHVADFVSDIRAGKKLKPVIFVKRPSQSLLLLVDGHHRYLASLQEDIPVKGFVGTVASDTGPWQVMHKQQEDGQVSAVLAQMMLSNLASRNGHAKAGA